VRLLDIVQAGFKDGSGQALTAGTVTAYDAGTSNLRTVYQDFDLTTPHANPFTLDSEGKATAYTNQRVKLVVKTSGGATVATIDNVGTSSTDISATAAEDLAGSGLTAPGDGTMAVNPDATTVEIDSDQVRVKPAGITARQIGAAGMGIAGVQNCVVTASVGSSALTIAIKTQAGTDPSSTDPVNVMFRSSTLTSGSYERRQLTTALSTVIASGSTLGHTNATEWPIYVYLLDNAGTLKIAYSTSPVDERYLQTTVDENGNGDSVSALYGEEVWSNCPVRLVAVFKSTQTTAGTWAVVPTAISIPTAAHPISVAPIRPVHTTVGVGGIARSASVTAYSNATGTYSDIASVTITVTGTRPVRIELSSDGNGAGNESRITVSRNAANMRGNLKFLRDSTEIAVLRQDADITGATAVSYSTSSAVVTDHPTAGTYTYKVQGRVANALNSETIAVAYMRLYAYEVGI
jgi:hypothetical protein